MRFLMRRGLLVVISATSVVGACAPAAKPLQVGQRPDASQAAPVQTGTTTETAKAPSTRVAAGGAGQRTAAGGTPEADLCVVPPGAQPLLPARLLEGMGVTEMPVTTRSEEARRFFTQGISQLHSFWVIEAERSFLQAATLDPEMAMAWWGIAISAAGDHRPAFQLRREPNDGGLASLTSPAGTASAGRAASAPSGSDADRAAAGANAGAGRGPGGEATIARTANGAAIDPSVRAREAIERAMALRDKVTPRERLYIEAQWARRNPASKTRDADHIAGLRKLTAAFPDDLEARSLLGLALLDGFDSVTKAPREHTLEGIRLLESIVEKDDNHFGAHHYLIHGYEGSTTPEKAWRACERYPALVPNVPHALHMPGHIYAQSDRTADAVAAFTAAAANELTYMNADVLYPNGHHGHNIHFLVHALNLDGRFRESLLQTRHLLSFRETPRERQGLSQRVTWRQGYYALVKTLVRFERWDDILDGRTIPIYDKPEQQAWHAWALGLAHSAKGHPADAQKSLDALRDAVKSARSTRGPLQIAVLELEGTIAARGGNRAAGYAQLRKAADQEAALPYTEPPAYPRPVVEGWANVALALGDFTAAEAAYREALTREPGSGRAYFGQAASLQGLGRTADARVALEKAARAWRRADSDLPQLRQLAAASSAARAVR